MAKKEAQLLAQAASQLNVQPEELASVIALESGFNPAVWGGDKGQYFGLIQFGPGARKETGLDPSVHNTFEAQLPYVVDYFKKRGFDGANYQDPAERQLKLYNTVLGGNPNANPNAQDAFGTSANKVLNRMLAGDLRNRAIAFLGDGQTYTGGSMGISQAQPAAQLTPVVPDPLAGTLAVGLDGSIIDYGQMAESLAQGDPYTAIPKAEAESLAPVGQRADQLYRNRPKPIGTIQSAINEALNAATFDVLDLPTEGTFSPLAGRLLGSIGNVGAAIGAGTLFGGPVGGLAAGVAAGFGQGYGRGVDEQMDRGIPFSQVNQTGPVVQGGTEAVLNALLPAQGASVIGTALKTAGRDALIGTPASVASQILTTGQVDPYRTAIDSAGYAGGGFASGALGHRGAVKALPQPTPTATARALPSGAPIGLLPPGKATNAQIARNLIEGRATRLLPGRKTVTTADGRSTFEIATNAQGPFQRLAGDAGIRIGEGTTQPVDVPFQKVEQPAGNILQGEVVDALPVETPVPVGPRLNQDGYIDPATINPAVETVFKNRSSAIRGARNLGLSKADVQPVRVGPGQWMVHKVEDMTPASNAVDAPQVASVVDAAPESPMTLKEYAKRANGLDNKFNPQDKAGKGKRYRPPQAFQQAYDRYLDDFNAGRVNRTGQRISVPDAATVSNPGVTAIIDQAAQPAMAVQAATDSPATVRMPKPVSVQQAYRGLDPVDSATVHDFDLSATKPGDVVPGLGRYRGVDEDGLPDIARRGGGKRPGESGVAYDAESLPTLLKQAGDLLGPDDVAMVQGTLNDIQSGMGSRFVGRAKMGRSSDVASALNTPATSSAYGSASFDRVLHIEYKPATKAVGKKPGTPAQVRAKVIDSNGQPAIRIIKEAGNPDVGYVRTGSDKLLDNHSPTLLDPSKRGLVTDAQIQQAGAVRQAAQGTKHANNPIVQRLDDVIRSNDDKAAQQAIRDLDRLSPELQEKLGIQKGCIKK